MNATSSNKETLKNYEMADCWAVADMVDNISLAYAECNGHSYNYKQSYYIWAAAYDTFMG